MSETISVSIDGTGLSDGLSQASAEVSRIATEEIAPAAALIEDAFAGAAQTIERELSRAARSGELSLKSLSRALVRDLSRTAIDGLVRRPLENLLSNTFAAPFGGGRAEGGFVAPGQSFLVGERGPELFTPSSAGSIGGTNSVGRGPVNVSISLPGVTDAESFRQSETQLAAGLQRVLARGQRNS